MEDQVQESPSDGELSDDEDKDFSDDENCLHTYRYMASSSSPEGTADRATAVSAIREMYTAGVPFFCRETIASVVRQLEAAKDKDGCQTIDVKAINGETLKFNLDTGRVCWPTYKDGLEYILAEPEVEYWTYHKMISTGPDFAPPLPICSLYISHCMIWRDHITKEPHRPPRQTSLIDTRNCFLETQRLWSESVACKELESILQQKLPYQTDTVVAFALGTMSMGGERGIRSSLFQHALARTVQDVVKASNQCQVQCFSQDPMYNTVDKQVLGEIGISVLDNPRAFLEVTNSSVVISVAPNIPVKEIVTDLSRPAALIWNTVTGKTHECTDPDSPRVVQLIRDHYEGFTFSGDKDIFSDLTVYVRRADKSKDNGGGGEQRASVDAVDGFVDGWEKEEGARP
ncbi:hypothetical protein DM02DRAFT_672162 [Periconia macrospinosa]|uniref:SRR1-like domain-containing protein n=1 Tax=Periconia macrospinosa TaxID=97972 RepID=A0A2V1DQ11_9PLEO|nr:hypothetical protein DM02DRAFT_672162 [Periconia macrospinosa]